MDRKSCPCPHEVLICKWANDMEEDTITAVTGGAICQFQTCLLTQESCTLPGYAIYFYVFCHNLSKAESSSSGF